MHPRHVEILSMSFFLQHCEQKKTPFLSDLFLYPQSGINISCCVGHVCALTESTVSRATVIPL